MNQIEILRMLGELKERVIILTARVEELADKIEGGE